MTIRLEIKLYHLSECQRSYFFLILRRLKTFCSLPPRGFASLGRFPRVRGEDDFPRNRLSPFRTFLFFWPLWCQTELYFLSHSRPPFKVRVRVCGTNLSSALSLQLASTQCWHHYGLGGTEDWKRHAAGPPPRLSATPEFNWGPIMAGTRGVSHLMSEMWQRVGDKKETEADKRERVCDGIRKRSCPRWQ